MTDVLLNVALPMHSRIQNVTIFLDIHCFYLKIQGLEILILFVSVLLKRRNRAIILTHIFGQLAFGYVPKIKSFDRQRYIFMER